jgi:hypothetical protein
MIAEYIKSDNRITIELGNLLKDKDGKPLEIVYGKTQSEEKLIEEASKVFSKYLSLRTRDYYGEVLGVEKSVVFDVGLDTPLKVIMDLAAKDAVVDHKVVYAVGEKFEETKWDLMVQGGFLALAYQNLTGELPKQIIFDHIPRTDRRVCLYPVSEEDFIINPFDEYGTDDFKDWVRSRI